jgi:hypothetical protein
MGFSRQNNTLKRLPKRLLSLDPAPASLNSPPYIPGLPSAVYLIHLLRTFIEQVYRIGFLGTHFWTAFCCFKILLPGRASTSLSYWLPRIHSWTAFCSLLDSPSWNTADQVYRGGFPAYIPGLPSTIYLIHLPGRVLKGLLLASPADQPSVLYLIYLHGRVFTGLSYYVSR